MYSLEQDVVKFRVDVALQIIQNIQRFQVFVHDSRGLLGRRAVDDTQRQVTDSFNHKISSALQNVAVQ